LPEGSTAACGRKAATISRYANFHNRYGNNQGIEHHRETSDEIKEAITWDPVKS
jgi:hypothetical protein